MMNEARRCSRCGAEFPPAASPEGLCPRCLLSFAIGHDDTSEGVESAGVGHAVERFEGQLLASLVGRLVDDKYRIEKILGVGGMGAVYLATHVGTQRPVALKIVAPHLMANPEFVERFRREARAAGQLRHPNVVNVTDFGFARDGEVELAYLVMEYLDGQSLAEVLAKNRMLPLERVVDILEQVCAAVDEAHAHGILHRDLKPGNIWLEPDRRGGYTVKVLDFGLAKLLEVAGAEGLSGPQQVAVEGAPTQPAPIGTDSAVAPTPHAWIGRRDGEVTTLRLPIDDGEAGSGRSDEAQSAATHQAALTRVGSIVGTPLYMSPEQWRGEALDARSDVYSLGVIAYEMLAGAPPFVGDVSELLAQHTEREPVSLHSRRPAVPARVDIVIQEALYKHRSSRPESAGSFATALRANAEGGGAVVRRALALYAANFPTFIRFALVGGRMPAILCIALYVALHFAFTSLFPAASGAIIGSLLLILLLPAYGFLSQLILGGVFVPLVSKLVSAPLSPVRARDTLPIVQKSFVPLLAAAVLAQRFYLLLFLLQLLAFAVVAAFREPSWADNAWGMWWFMVLIWWASSKDAGPYGPIIMLERAQVVEAVRRAWELNRRAWELNRRSAKGSLGGVLRGLLKVNPVTSATFGLAALALLLGWSLAANANTDWVFGLAAGLCIALLLLLAALLNPLASICDALNYLQARSSAAK